MQRVERLLDWRVVVPAMYLIEIDIIRAEASQACIDLRHDGLARQAARVSAPTHREEDFSGDDYFFTPCEVVERAPDNLLARAVRVAVGRVEKVDAEFERPLDKRAAL